jgi:hypothetical protein
LNSNQGLKWLLKNITKDIEANKSFLPKHIGLHLPSDIGTDYAAYILDGCRLETVGYYENDGTLRIATKVFERLSPTSKAALLLHESIYKATRDLAAESNSTNARRFVAKLLANGFNDVDLTNDLNAVLSIARNPWTQNILIPVKSLSNSQIAVRVSFERFYEGMTATVNIKNRKGETIDQIRQAPGTDVIVKQISALEFLEFDTGYSTLRPNHFLLSLDNEPKPFFDLSTVDLKPGRWRIFVVQIGQ